jgi:predicted peptidase
VKQTSHVFHTVIPRSSTFQYLISIPLNYEKGNQDTWPVLLYLHGAGERGNDINTLLGNGLPAFIEAENDFPFITISPLCPVDTWWSDHLAVLDILLKEVCDRYRADIHRIAATGVSMGGYGVWHAGVIFPERFSCLVPIGGGGAWFYGFPRVVRKLINTPVWAFHGENDPIIPLRESSVLVRELTSAGGHAQLTVLPGGGHEIWQDVYTNPEVVNWMLAQSKLTSSEP